MSKWAALIQGDTGHKVTIEGLVIELKPIMAGALADCCTNGEIDVFAMIAATVVQPPISAEEVRKLSPGAFATLAAECHKTNGTNDALE